MVIQFIEVPLYYDLIKYFTIIMFFNFLFVYLFFLTIFLQFPWQSLRILRIFLIFHDLMLYLSGSYGCNDQLCVLCMYKMVKVSWKFRAQAYHKFLKINFRNSLVLLWLLTKCDDVVYHSAMFGVLILFNFKRLILKR